MTICGLVRTPSTAPRFTAYSFSAPRSTVTVTVYFCGGMVPCTLREAQRHSAALEHRIQPTLKMFRPGLWTARLQGPCHDLLVAVTSAPGPPIDRHKRKENGTSSIQRHRKCQSCGPGLRKRRTAFCMDIPTMLARVIHISLASQRLSGGCGALPPLDGFPALTASPAPNCGKGIEPDVVPSECVPVSQTTCFKPTPRHWW